MTRADELLAHLGSCYRCIGAKVARVAPRCPRRTELIKLTLKERHG